MHPEPSTARVQDPADAASWWSLLLPRLWPALLIVFIDQITKVLVERQIEPGTSIQLWGHWVVLTHQLNPAGAMSIRLGPPTFYLLVTLVVVLFLGYSLVRRPLGPYTRWALLLVLGGAIGNMIDRIRIGAVIDFIDVEFFDFSLPAIDFGPIHVPGDMMTRWPVFNVADACVSVGIVLLLLATFVFERHHEASQGAGD